MFLYFLYYVLVVFINVFFLSSVFCLCLCVCEEVRPHTHLAFSSLLRVVISRAFLLLLSLWSEGVELGFSQRLQDKSKSKSKRK